MSFLSFSSFLFFLTLLWGCYQQTNKTTNQQTNNPTTQQSNDPTNQQPRNCCLVVLLCCCLALWLCCHKTEKRAPKWLPRGLATPPKGSQNGVKKWKNASRGHFLPKVVLGAIWWPLWVHLGHPFVPIFGSPPGPKNRSKIDPWPQKGRQEAFLK